MARVAASVPNEEPNARTVRIALAIPERVLLLNVPAKPGWRVTLRRTPLPEPLLVNGRLVENRVTTVIWSGGSYGGSERQEFPVRIGVQAAGGATLAFPATQTYSDGHVVRWIGPAGSARPRRDARRDSARLLRRRRYAFSRRRLHRHLRPRRPRRPEETVETRRVDRDRRAEAAAAPSAEDEDDGGSGALVAVLLIAGGLVAAGVVVAVLLRRRRPA